MIQVGLGVLFLLFAADAFKRSGIENIEPHELAIWCALTTFIFFALALTKNMPEGVSLNYSGAAFLALTLGYSRALLSMALLLIITQPIAGIGVGLLIDALLPVWLMVSLVGLTRRYLPSNPFVFLLGCSFLGLFIVYGIQEIAGAALRGAMNHTPVLSAIVSEPTGWGLLLASGEATLEGMIITILVVYYPRAVAMFDDDFYLSRPS